MCARNGEICTIKTRGRAARSADRYHMMRMVPPVSTWEPCLQTQKRGYDQVSPTYAGDSANGCSLNWRSAAYRGYLEHAPRARSM
ncbi:hypothetical protein CERSUDRAFT_112704 [Gelatoporia subvermispora B]|uniref:Uncharacterized protein n=1 Tax=Ceriporiopsis subvermispora (strain B) TaxID=914234 RepID=M2RKL1_CERS8|nr:hypothetical protein CERSUDRAFT_112704 [Gelatoporia subvermispora B]